VVFAPEAQDDVRAMYAHIAEDSPANAQRFIRDLVRQIYKLAELHIDGVSRDWIRPNLRAFPYRNRCIYFRVEGDTLYVLRVFHGARDVDRQFPDD